MVSAARRTAHSTRTTNGTPASGSPATPANGDPSNAAPAETNAAAAFTTTCARDAGVFDAPRQPHGVVGALYSRRRARTASAAYTHATSSAPACPAAAPA